MIYCHKVQEKYHTKQSAGGQVIDPSGGLSYQKPGNLTCDGDQQGGWMDGCPNVGGILSSIPSEVLCDQY